MTRDLPKRLGKVSPTYFTFYSKRADNFPRAGHGVGVPGQRGAGGGHQDRRGGGGRARGGCSSYHLPGFAGGSPAECTGAHLREEVRTYCHFAVLCGMLNGSYLLNNSIQKDDEYFR